MGYTLYLRTIVGVRFSVGDRPGEKVVFHMHTAARWFHRHPALWWFIHDGCILS